MHTRPFLPRFSLRNAHVQTLFAAFPPPLRLPSDETFRVPLGGDDWLFARAVWGGEGRRTTALLVHGMGGSSESAYLTRAAQLIRAKGFHSVALDLRGTNASAGGANTLYHAGLIDDLVRTIAHLETHPRVGNVVVVGFSLGGQASLLLASSWGDSVPNKVKSVVALSAPLDLEAGARHLDTLSAFPYRQYVLRALKRNALALTFRASTPFTREDVSRMRTLYDFDDGVTAKLHGFNSASHYYDSVSAGPRLSGIRVPTTIVVAKDDPMVPYSILREHLMARSPSTRLVETERGGHLGFVEHPFDVIDTWGNRQITNALVEADRDTGERA